MSQVQVKMNAKENESANSKVTARDLNSRWPVRRKLQIIPKTTRWRVKLKQFEK